MSVYEKFPFFITSDPRRNRSGNEKKYTVDSTLMDLRHDSFFYDYDLTGKKILDIGCCVGATGAYVLDKGASFYHGIDFESSLVEIAKLNLSQSFPNKTWKVEQGSLEDFSKNNTEHYDVIVLSGVIYAVFDCIPILTDLAKNTDCLIVEGMHPSFTKNIPEKVSMILKQFKLWEGFIENASFIEYDYLPMAINNTVVYYGSRQSLGFINQFLNSLGFKGSGVVNHQLKDKIPYLYNSHNRYGERYEKIGEAKGRGYVDFR